MKFRVKCLPIATPRRHAATPRDDAPTLSDPEFFLRSHWCVFVSSLIGFLLLLSLAPSPPIILFLKIASSGIAAATSALRPQSVVRQGTDSCYHATFSRTLEGTCRVTGQGSVMRE